MSNQMQVYQQTRDLLKSVDVKQRFQEIMGEKAQAFLASVLSVVYQDDKLKECDPQSILYAAMKAAVLDLPIEQNLGQSYIIPYKGKATFQIGYRGIIRLALRTKEYDVINADKVYEGENVVVDRLTGRITFNGKRKSDKVIGAFAYFKLKDGFEKYLYMTTEELEAHGKRYSPSYSYDSSLWKKDPKAMYLKTVLKMLLSRYGPLSVDVKVILAEDDHPEEVIDADSRLVGEEEPDLEPEVKEKPKPKAKVEAPPPPPPAPVVIEQPEEPEPPPPFEDEPVTQSAANDVPMWQMIVMSGILSGDATSKTAMRFYNGPNDWEHVEPWARKVKLHLQNGDTLGAACNKANA